ncbi:hypothetical protein [Bacteroides reticulotermitis]|uniref:hypothetical protein n=1 Tax=Bacteroides reticulotermitis TaxID=1133319 RepID=UPI003A83F9BA
MKIKSITIVSSVGVNSYTVGIRRVIDIKETTKQIGSDSSIKIYQVIKTDGMTEISASCPLQIDYEEELA